MVGAGTEQNYHRAFMDLTSASASTIYVEPNCFYWLGELLRMGWGCEMDERGAFDSFLKGLETSATNVSKLQMALGRAFYHGEGVDEDIEEAVKWLTLSLESDRDRESVFYLARCYLEDDHKDIVRATELLKEAAGLGLTAAEAWLEDLGQSSPLLKYSDQSLPILRDEFLVRARQAFSELTFVKRDPAVDQFRNVVSLPQRRTRKPSSKSKS